MLGLVQTADGSNTIYNSLVGESYHSKFGALQESLHVFVNSGLVYFLDRTDGVAEASRLPGRVSVLEVGFGTGLNFLLSAELCAKREISLDYTGIEAYPLIEKLINATGYGQYVSPGLWDSFTGNYEKLLHDPVALNPGCRLEVANCGLLDFQSGKQYDIIYYDAFAVARQPEMWTETAIAHAIRFLKPDGIFVTYAITGNLKRALKALGCKVEKAPGAAGKREMLRAVKFEN